jgi:hypothetical protein
LAKRETVSRGSALILLALTGWGSIDITPASTAAERAERSADKNLVALGSVIAAPAAHLTATVVADGSEVLALDEPRREVLQRWVRRGGRLLLTGDGVEPVFRWLNADKSCGNASCPVGLGEAAVIEDLRLVEHARSTSQPVDVLVAAAALARTGLPDERLVPLTTGARLAAYGLLLGLGFLATRRFPRVWRRAGAASLVLVFGLWPWWGNDASADHEAQVDVVVLSDEDPAIIWSALALRSRGRHPISVETGTGSWNLQSTGSGAIASPGEDANGPLVAQNGESVVLYAVRGERFDLAWFADDDAPGGVAAQFTHRDGRLTGLLRNRFARPWSEVWLLVPGREPLRLRDLPASGAYVLDFAEPGPGDGPAARKLGQGLSLERERLLRAALDGAVRPLLDRQRALLIAWSEGPLRPARLPGEKARSKGSTLLISTVVGST